VFCSPASPPLRFRQHRSQAQSPTLSRRPSLLESSRCIGGTTATAHGVMAIAIVGGNATLLSLSSSGAVPKGLHPFLCRRRRRNHPSERSVGQKLLAKRSPSSRRSPLSPLAARRTDAPVSRAATLDHALDRARVELSAVCIHMARRLQLSADPTQRHPLAGLRARTVQGRLARATASGLSSKKPAGGREDGLAWRADQALRRVPAINVGGRTHASLGL
jgi:hypothetical protein